jgi:MFS family permease
MNQALPINPLQKKTSLVINPDLHRSNQTLLQSQNFRSFYLSEGAGQMGANFFQLALPCLVMQLGGDAAAVGASILACGVSRMALVIIAGALCDRIPPKNLILAANLFKAAVLLVFTLILLTCPVNLWMLLGLSFLLGFGDAVSIPARAAALPQLVEREKLAPANSLLAVQERTWHLAGPALAGIWISWVDRLSDSSTTVFPHYPGATSTFLLVVLALCISTFFAGHTSFFNRQSGGLTEQPASPGIPLQETVVWVWSQTAWRSSFLMVYLVNIISAGPLNIGLPMLAASRFPDGAEALGVLTSCAGAGALAGAILSGVLPSGKPRYPALILTLIAALATLAASQSIFFASLAVMTVTAVVSYVSITGTAEIQRNVSPANIGKVMGLLNFK